MCDKMRDTKYNGSSYTTDSQKIKNDSVVKVHSLITILCKVPRTGVLAVRWRGWSVDSHRSAPACYCLTCWSLPELFGVIPVICLVAKHHSLSYVPALLQTFVCVIDSFPAWVSAYGTLADIGWMPLALQVVGGCVDGGDGGRKARMSWDANRDASMAVKWHHIPPEIKMAGRILRYPCRHPRDVIS